MNASRTRRIAVQPRADCKRFNTSLLVLHYIDGNATLWLGAALTCEDRGALRLTPQVRTHSNEPHQRCAVKPYRKKSTPAVNVELKESKHMLPNSL